jgi:hypothetical protein
MHLVIAALLLCAACRDHDHDGYATLQACFDEHTMEESLPFKESVVICCLDHPLDGVSEACGATAADCVAYVNANLTSTATAAEIQAACDDYVTQKGM